MTTEIDGDREREEALGLKPCSLSTKRPTGGAIIINMLHLDHSHLEQAGFFDSSSAFKTIKCWETIWNHAGTWQVSRQVNDEIMTDGQVRFIGLKNCLSVCLSVWWWWSWWWWWWWCSTCLMWGLNVWMVQSCPVNSGHVCDDVMMTES